MGRESPEEKPAIWVIRQPVDRLRDLRAPELEIKNKCSCDTPVASESFLAQGIPSLIVKKMAAPPRQKDIRPTVL